MLYGNKFKGSFMDSDKGSFSYGEQPASSASQPR